jgi:ankyrin repeat protein
LLQAGADPNEPDLEKWTPLHAAAHWGQKEACKLLSDYGADFTLRNHVVS